MAQENENEWHRTGAGEKHSQWMWSNVVRDLNHQKKYKQKGRRLNESKLWRGCDLPCTLMMPWQVASGSPTRLVSLMDIIWSPTLSLPERAAGPLFNMLARMTVGRMEPQPDSTITTPRFSPFCFCTYSWRTQKITCELLSSILSRWNEKRTPLCSCPSWRNGQGHRGTFLGSWWCHCTVSGLSLWDWSHWLAGILCRPHWKPDRWTVQSAVPVETGSVWGKLLSTKGTKARRWERSSEFYLWNYRKKNPLHNNRYRNDVQVVSKHSHPLTQRRSRSFCTGSSLRRQTQGIRRNPRRTLMTWAGGPSEPQRCRCLQCKI